MVRYIIIALIAFTLIAFAVAWVLGGGPRRAVGGAQNLFVSAIPTEEEMQFRLPWQPVELFPTLDITGALDFTEEDTSTTDPEERLRELEAEYDRLDAEVRTTRTFGNPSPYLGKVSILEDISGVRGESAGDEYLQIGASHSNSEAIDISGWVLESALSGTRVILPPAASPFVANSSNTVVSVRLEPGSLALVSSAASPVGVSFRENMCTGYLAQFQSFSPPLAESCPSPSQVLPFNEENLVRYGDACFDAIANLSACRFPAALTNVSGACRSYLTEFLSYNGCVNQNRSRSSFTSNMWRLYLGSRGELWRNSHDAIRLLDAEGRTVSVFVY